MPGPARLKQTWKKSPKSEKGISIILKFTSEHESYKEKIELYLWFGMWFLNECYLIQNIIIYKITSLSTQHNYFTLIF